MTFNIYEKLKKEEGFSETVYNDHLGNDTIGFGFLIKSLVLDEDIAETILYRLIHRISKELSIKIQGFLGFPTIVQDAFVEVAYQIGVAGFLKFRKTIKFAQKEDWNNMLLELLDSKWARIDTPERASRLAWRIRDEICD